MSPEECDAVLTWDEMSIKEHLEFNSKIDFIEGLEDLGELGRTNRSAKYALVFMIRGLKFSWKLPIAYFISSQNITSSKLANLIKSCVTKCFKVGIRIRSTVCDQASTNCQAVKVLGVSESQPYFFIDENKIYFNYDICHLMKSVHNRLIANDILVGDERVSWKAIVELFNNKTNKASKTAPKLSIAHINPNNWQKMKVRFAVQVFSASVAAALKTEKLNGALREPTCIPTADLCKKLNNVFDCLNASCSFDSNSLRRGISIKTPQVLTCLEESREWLNTWVYDTGRKSPPCFAGLKLSINSIILFARDLFAENVPYLLIARLNQDCIENLFGNIRRRSGNNCNPSALQFRHNLQYTIVARLVAPPKGSNCMDDNTTFMAITKNRGICEAYDLSVDMHADTAVGDDNLDMHADMVVGDDSLDDSMSEYLLDEDDDDDSVRPITLEMCAMRYVAGYLAYRCIVKFDCSKCRVNLLKTGEELEDNTELLIFLKAYDTKDGATFGHLNVPSDSFSKLIITAYQVFSHEFPKLFSSLHLSKSNK